MLVLYILYINTQYPQMLYDSTIYENILVLYVKHYTPHLYKNHIENGVDILCRIDILGGFKPLKQYSPQTRYLYIQTDIKGFYYKTIMKIPRKRLRRLRGILKVLDTVVTGPALLPRLAYLSIKHQIIEFTLDCLFRAICKGR